MARRKNPQIHHVDFAKVNRRWVAYIYIDPNTTISQQTVGSKKNVDKIIKTQLEPQGIPYTIEGMAGLVPKSRQGSYPGDIGKIPKTKAAFRKEYYGLLTKYFSTKHYKGGGAWELPTAESRRIGARLAELYDAHPRWADQIDEEWGADQRRNPRSTRYAFSSVRRGDYGGATSKAELIKDVRANLKRIATKEERSHAVEQLQHLQAARLLTSAEFWKLVDVADAALAKAGRKKSNPRRRNSRALWSRNKWRIEWYDPQAKWRGFYVVGENHAEHPIIYFDGSIAYDRPELVPQYVQKAVAQLARKYESQMDGYNNPKRRKKSNPRNPEMGKWTKTLDGYYQPNQSVSYLIKKGSARRFQWELYVLERDAKAPEWKLMGRYRTLKDAKEIASATTKAYFAQSNPKRRKNVNAEIFTTYARGRGAKFGSGPFKPKFKRMRRNSKHRSNLVFFMETRGGKYNVKVYKVGKKYEMVVHERGQPDLTAQTTSKAELSAIVGQFYRVGYMTGTAKYKVKHDALGLGIK